MEFAKDRFPTGHPEKAPERLLICFNKIKDLCGLRDTAGRDPAPSLWTYSKRTHNGLVYSRLDRIYRPSQGWTSGSTVPMDTGKSDHRLLMAMVHVVCPKVEKAVPAPRLPSLEALDKTQDFWPSVLRDWEHMTRNAPITLESWKTFKDQVLQTGIREMKAVKSAGKKDWVTALRNECIPPEEIMDAAARANRQVWARRTPPARTPAKWPTAIPAYEVAPKQSKHFAPSKSSPWRTPIRQTNTATLGSRDAPPPIRKTHQ